MSNTPTNPPASKLDWDAAKKHLDNIEKYLRTFAGKEGHNPFMVINEKINPLKAALARKGYENDTSLYNDIIKLKEEPPTVVSRNVSRLPDKPLIITKS